MQQAEATRDETGNGFDGQLRGEVVVAAPRIDAASRSVAVRAVLTDPDRAPAGGGFVEVSLVFAEYPALTVLDDANASEGDATSVTSSRRGGSRRRDVDPGGLVGRWVAAAGLGADARVVLTG